MSHRWSIPAVFITCMVVVTLVVYGLTTWLLYRAVLNDRCGDLMAMLDSQVGLIESVVRFERDLLPEAQRGSAEEKLVAQVTEVHRSQGGFDETGEIVIARRVGDRIQFLLEPRFPTVHGEGGLDPASPLAEPMRRALDGERGTVVGLDYRGETVLAAFEPVPALNIGVVAKIDLAEIRRPFVRTMPVTGFISLIIVMAGWMLVMRFTNRAVGRIEEGESRIRAIVETAVDGIVTIDDKGIVQELNSSAERIFGYTRDEVLGRNVSMLMPEPYRGEHDSYLANYLRTGRGKIIGVGREVTGLKSDGTTFPLDLRVSEVRFGDTLLYTGILRDITQLKESEAALRLSERRLNRAFTGTSDGLWEWKITTDEVWYAPRFKEMLGYDDADFPDVLESFVSHLHDDDREPTMAAVGRHLEDDEPYDVEYRLRCRNGGHRWFRARGKVERDEQGRPVMMSGSIQDITDRKRDQLALREAHEQLTGRAAELAAARDQAQAADRVKSAFLANMSHELRTPLNSIIGFTGVLLQGLAGDLNEEQYKQMEMVRGSSRHLLELINDVLDISKIEADQLELVNRPFDLDESVCKVVGTLAATAAAKGLELTAEVAPDAGSLIADRRRVEQVLLNLVNNAVKFTDAGSVHVDCRREDRQVRIRVIDTGIGITAEDLPRLFRPFSQVETTLSRRFEGTGLGLAITRKLVERMGGSIAVHSEPDRGSTFEVRLPLEQEAVTHE